MIEKKNPQKNTELPKVTTEPELDPEGDNHACGE